MKSFIFYRDFSFLCGFLQKRGILLGYNRGFPTSHKKFAKLISNLSRKFKNFSNGKRNDSSCSFLAVFKYSKYFKISSLITKLFLSGNTFCLSVWKFASFFWKFCWNFKMGNEEFFRKSWVCLFYLSGLGMNLRSHPKIFPWTEPHFWDSNSKTSKLDRGRFNTYTYVRAMINLDLIKLA